MDMSEQIIVTGCLEHRRVVDQRPEAVVVVGMGYRATGFAHLGEEAVRIFPKLRRMMVQVDSHACIGLSHSRCLRI